LCLAAGAAALLAPLHANGVSGNALRPHYSDFGWFADTLVTANPTRSDLEAAGVVFPQQRVADRRHAAEGLGGLAVLTLSGGLLARRTRRSDDHGSVAG
jgi:hypothetical protein